jgi:hypothetical protein
MRAVTAGPQATVTSTSLVQTATVVPLQNLGKRVLSAVISDMAANRQSRVPVRSAGNAALPVTDYGVLAMNAGYYCEPAEFAPAPPLKTKAVGHIS